MSLSARRVWIEIARPTRGTQGQYVALRKESVDRNQAEDISARREARSLSARRVWIEIPYRLDPQGRNRSLSARRVWIEMLASRLVDMSAAVALRKESVDRNEGKLDADLWVLWSLSARRVWIEILNSIKRLAMSVGRSPQGECG